MKPERVSITSATPGRTLDVETRQKRYLLTMLFRTLCFVGILFVPGVWRWVLLIGAAFLPAVAVVFANAADHRPLPIAPDDEPVDRPALPAAMTIPGEIE